MNCVLFRGVNGMWAIIFSLWISLFFKKKYHKNIYKEG